MLSDTFRKRLWHEATERVAYAVLDGAQNKSLLDWLFSADPPKFECLFAGELDPDIAEVAPYLVQLAPETRFTQELIEAGWEDRKSVV